MQQRIRCGVCGQSNDAGSQACRYCDHVFDLTAEELDFKRRAEVAVADGRNPIRLIAPNARIEIRGAETLTDEQFSAAIANGGRFVVYSYSISLVFVTFRQSSAVHLVRADETGIWNGIPYTLLSLVAGWWGFPFGPIFTVMSIYRNSVGGLDVTDEVLGSLDLLTRRS